MTAFLASLRDPALVATVVALLAAACWATRSTTAAEIRRGFDASLIAGLPETARHEVLCAKRAEAEQRARAEAAERDLADALLRLEAVRQALADVAPASIGPVLRASGRR